ncbi:hypothetical protein S40285_10819 [Stachybotrys chlorohalonatus IBT 40285]|uniref:Uncharacterized protein n=1 Tax=Stachybotrys chlorohalonatus (strain IBT 40285) TaxID=1283841 RepID=A0A084QNH0_STAC4|nr:hypothetical protein S40285_10819 [Stachybotrys chlorohalonata IBT 40285]
MVSSPTERNISSPAPGMASQLDGSVILDEVTEIFDVRVANPLLGWYTQADMVQDGTSEIGSNYNTVLEDKENQGDTLLILRNIRCSMKARSISETFKYRAAIHSPGNDGRVKIAFTPRKLGLVNIKLRVQYIGKHDTSAPSMNSTPPSARRRANNVNTAFYGSRSNGSPDFGETEHLPIDTKEPQKDGDTTSGSPRKRAISPDVTGAAGKRQRKQDA